MMPIANGVWPTMITPFNEHDQVDFDGLERLIEWYIEKGAHGLFAVCQSSEMFLLSLEERIQLATFVKKHARGRVPVIASGHISDRFEDQVKELNLIADTGIDALVLITNRLAAPHESDDIWKKNVEKLLQEIPQHIPLGFYECPYPYKRLISPELLKWCDETGRFLFLKDTSCDMNQLAQKREAVEGGTLHIYNANSATLLESLKLGIAGYSGIMANFHPELYVWLLDHWKSHPEESEHVISLLSMTSLIEKQLYPTNAKYYLMLEGVLSNDRTRVQRDERLTSTQKLEVEQLRGLSSHLRRRLMGC